MRALALILFLFSASVKAANIMVIDGGLEPAYRSTLQNQGRLLRESCYSYNGQVRMGLNFYK